MPSRGRPRLPAVGPPGRRRGPAQPGHVRIRTSRAGHGDRVGRRSTRPPTGLGAGHGDGARPRDRPRPPAGRAHRPGAGLAALSSRTTSRSIELDEPALPWLFTPAGADAQAHLRPWLCLVVVRQQDGVRLDPPTTGPLPVLRDRGPAKPGDELPDLADSWAWAHGQVTSETTDDLASSSSSPATRSAPCRGCCARGCCEPDTEYLACVVPDLRARAARPGSATTITADDEAKSRARVDAGRRPAVELPVYYSWAFATGAGGDFQSLAMLLRARPLPDGDRRQTDRRRGERAATSDVPAEHDDAARGCAPAGRHAPTRLAEPADCRRRGSRPCGRC